MKKSVTIIGAGKLGRALCNSLYKSAYTIDCVISASKKSAEKLASDVNSLWSVDSSAAIDSDYVIIAVPDGVIAEVVSLLRVSENTIVVHTAGSVGLNVLDNLECRVKGILYPMQTFSEGRSVSMDKVPVLIEADTEQGLIEIEELALDISSKVSKIDSDKREKLHLAAVIVSNFVNHMYCLANEVLDNYNISPELLNALKRETVEKSIQLGPEKSQTGPAVRNDKLTIEKQRDLLSFSPEIQELYIKITDSIIQKNRKETDG